MNLRSTVTRVLTTGLTLLSTSWGSAYARPATRVAEAIWAHDRLYATVATDTAFTSPPRGSTDVIYSFGMSGLAGQRSVAESAPGDPDYNGGRWAVIPVVFTDQGLAVHDPDGDGIVNFELTNAEQVAHHAELGHLILAEAPALYFECPLLPR